MAEISGPAQQGLIYFPRCKPRLLFDVWFHIVKPASHPDPPRLGEWDIACRVWRRSIRRLAPKTVWAYFGHPVPRVSVEWFADGWRYSGDGLVTSVLKYLPDERFNSLEFTGNGRLKRQRAPDPDNSQKKMRAATPGRRR